MAAGCCEYVSRKVANPSASATSSVGNELQARAQEESQAMLSYSQNFFLERWVPPSAPLNLVLQHWIVEARASLVISPSVYYGIRHADRLLSSVVHSH